MKVIRDYELNRELNRNQISEIRTQQRPFLIRNAIDCIDKNMLTDNDTQTEFYMIGNQIVLICIETTDCIYGWMLSNSKATQKKFLQFQIDGVS